MLLIFVASIGIIVWSFCPHSYNPSGDVSASDIAYFTNVPPPPEAHNFRAASRKFQNARLVFVRFSAPVEVCQKYAAVVMPNATLKPLNFDQRSLDVGLLGNGSYQLDDVSWFDLPYAKPFWDTQSGKSIVKRPSGDIPLCPEVVGADSNTWSGYETTSVRVDTSRGVFYFLQAN